jgi:2',3'-cyclic-nucleotide 3'-phosphodiesterase
MPPHSVAEELKELMNIRKGRPHSSDTYPQFEPHITLASIKSDTPISLSSIRESIQSVQGVFHVKFESVDIGQHYFRSVYVSIRLDETLADLHKTLHEKLGKAPNTPKFPHMSLVYVNDEDAAEGEKEKYYEELKERQLIASDSSGGVKLRANTEKEWIGGFLTAEIWVTRCVGPVESWEVLDKITLS